MSFPSDVDALSLPELRALVLALITRVTDLEGVVVAQRNEIARLKGLAKRPTIKPSGMDKGTQPKPSAGPGKSGRRGGHKTVRRTITEDRVISVAAPPGSRFKGYQDFVVQDLVFRPHIVRYRRERWLLADGQTVTAALPAGVSSHFGPELRRFVLAQHRQGQVTVRRMAAQLNAIGIDISNRQVMRLLIASQDGFLDEARDVLRAGLAAGAWITDLHRTAQAHLRGLIWWFYRDLKAYRLDPTPRRRAALRLRFDRIFKRRTGFTTLDQLLKRQHANKEELLMVLNRPEIPLHTNGSENDIRCQVTKRKVSGGTRSDTGRDCRDAFLGLAKTCAKLGIQFWDYLASRLTVPGCQTIAPLTDIVRMRCITP